ncbi:hypothetical protein MNBD_GAMMA10-627 [hydrothermal vent metagenome]|uniref:Uncharacterized protein n=1 Tax=hydrothermal vent metagenome TaxID=652676 RepID=A0A3B0Y1L0_9ZZZZ
MKKSLEIRFERLISGMNLPESRKTYTPENVLYFLRKGAIVNTLHKNHTVALQVARELV